MSFRKGYCPEAFKRSIFSSIHKSGEKLIAGNYRHILLISGLAEVDEKVTKIRITVFIQKINFFALLSNRQFGFRSGKSIQDVILIDINSFVYLLSIKLVTVSFLSVGWLWFNRSTICVVQQLS